MKKLIAFDQDDTINITKLPLDDEMAGLLSQLLDKFKVCIISGTNWEVMKKNDIDTLKKLKLQSNFSNYYFMPTTGTQYWHYVGNDITSKSEKVSEDGWILEYAHFLTEGQANKIMSSLETAAKKLGYWCENPAGEIIENRGSQITFSALGQWATPEDKHDWDPDMTKRREIVALVKLDLEGMDVDVVAGGSTSVDIMLSGVDKAYGMKQLMKQLHLEKEDILFIGDNLKVGGNDYPVKAFGIDTIQVTNCEDTKWILKGIINTFN